MPQSAVSRLVVCSLIVFAASGLRAQDAAEGLQRSVRQQTAPPAVPAAAVDAAAGRVQAGSAIGATGTSLETSEALFSVMAGLNACGYDAGMATAPAIRRQVRQELKEAAAASPDAADAHSKLCTFIRAHDMGDPVKTLSQYVSLALVLVPGEGLDTDPNQKQLPPDASQVANILPLLRRYSAATHLHALWLLARPAYEAAIAPLREPLTKILLSEGVYLRLTEAGNDRRRFIVFADPLLAPGLVSARIYGLDYLMVLAPPVAAAEDASGSRFLDDVRHFYLQFSVDPVLYSYPRAMERLEPILTAVREAPLEQVYRDDIAALVSECIIRAIEAHTMNTGIVVPKFKPGERLQGDESRLYLARSQQDEATRVAQVERDVAQGYVLTRYFYGQFAHYEKNSETLRDALGEMVYGMDPYIERDHAKHIVFVAGGGAPGRTGGRPTLAARAGGLTPEGGSGAPADKVAEAEQQFVEGRIDEAAVTAQAAIDAHQGDAGRATYILAQDHAVHGEMEEAQASFHQALTLTKDPHTLAWSHVYLGRIADIKGERDEALKQYKDALGVKSGLDDADAAAHKGIATPFAIPAGAHAGASPPNAPPGASGADGASGAGTSTGQSQQDPAR